MNTFFDSIDLSENIQRGIQAIRGIVGLPALILGIALASISFGLTPLIWYFDIGATYDWTDIAIQKLMPTLPSQLSQFVPVFVLILTLMPTLIELFTARFAMSGIRVAAGIIYMFSLFDAVTDYPRVAAFMEAYRPAFDGLGLLSFPTFWVVRTLWLFMASFGFEILFCVFAVCAISLFLNVKTQQQAQRPGVRP